MTKLSFERRDFLKAVAAAGAPALLGPLAAAQVAVGSKLKSLVTEYLEKLARTAGGYGWVDQRRPHLTPTFAVVGAYVAMNQKPVHSRAIASFVRENHPAKLKKLEQEHRSFDYQQIQSLKWLGEDASEFRETVLAWKSPRVYLKQYEQQGYPVFQQEIAAILCRPLLGLPLDELPTKYVEYLDSRRRTNGSFNNTPSDDGSEGNILNTWSGLQALQVLNRTSERRDDLIDWLRRCQLPNGGFTYQPNAEVGGVDDVAYTWAGVRSLAVLNAAPSDRAGCIRYLQSLFNEDGGFADRPGWASNPVATYYALDSLAALQALEGDIPVRRSSRSRADMPHDLQVFSIQLESHGKGSPIDAVELASALRIHLWGAKNASPEWLARAQALADERKVPVNFFVANEEYGTWVSFAGLGTYSHTSDIIAPRGISVGDSLAGQGNVSWSDYRRRRLAPLTAADGRLIWQFGENEPLVRILLDDSLERGGFAAISTFHFGNPDFTNSEPFLKRFRMQLPFVALQDAHGNEPWWFSDMTVGFRTLFLAHEPTWKGWLHALKQNWVVAVRHDNVTGNETWMHGGPDQVLEHVRSNWQQWQWWDNPEIQRPMLSVAVLRSSDEWEAGRPSDGVAIRVRCAWENTPQGLAKKPLAKFVKLSINGQAVHTELVERRRPNGLLEDHYQLYQLPQLSRGSHSATATAQVISTGTEVDRTVEFVV